MTEEYPLSELESTLLERFRKEKVIYLDQMNEKERGALGKLASRQLVTRESVPVKDATVMSGVKIKRAWVLKEAPSKPDSAVDVKVSVDIKETESNKDTTAG